MSAYAKNLPRLENWFMTESDMLIGEVYNHPLYPDGEVVVTSRVADLDVASGLAVTRNTNYILGKRFKEKK